MGEGLLNSRAQANPELRGERESELGMDEMKEVLLEYIRQRIRKSNLDTRPNLDADEAEAEMAHFMSRER